MKVLFKVCNCDQELCQKYFGGRAEVEALIVLEEVLEVIVNTKSLNKSAYYQHIYFIHQYVNRH